MKYRFIDDREIDYDGRQLSSLFALANFEVQGDSVVAFIGKCDVELANMIDLMDVKEGKAIYSERMLHFIGEFFDRNLDKMILRERLLAAVILEQVVSRKSGIEIERDGDDIFIEGRKATVGIATLSPVSGLMHVGINISSKNTPVKTTGLDDLEIDAGDFALAVLEKYAREIKKNSMARSKVRGVK